MGMVAVIVVSRSLAVMVSSLAFTSKRKLSRIGRVLLLASTPCKVCSCFNRALLDTMNFIEAAVLVRSGAVAVSDMCLRVLRGRA